MKLSPLAPQDSPELPAVAGVRLAAANCGIRYKNRADILLVELAENTQVAGVFTQSLTAAAPIHLCRDHLKNQAARALIVNAGNANAFTGKAGHETVSAVQEATCKTVGCKDHEFFMASTGVIGQKLPPHLLIDALPSLHLQLSDTAWADAASAIVTTDTFTKSVTRQCEIGGQNITINGIAKGSGMIAPDMATMLAFLFTDAIIPAPILQTLLSEANELSFNRITVDSDTSTSDTALIFATGQAKHPAVISASDPQLDSFRSALRECMIELAQMIVRDGEGASKFITIHVTGAENDRAAKMIALSIANSPLVKTAIAGEDANWGRIVAAIGKAGEKAERDRLRIAIGGICVAENGELNPDYHEADIVPHMKGQYVDIETDVGVGNGEAIIWTCDLTHGYIDINASYRT